MTEVTASWLTRDATQRVLSVLETGGAQALLVGGCVRNALIGMPVDDIDIATDSEPLHVMQLAHSQDIKVEPTGLSHGTVTLILNGIAHEVTTFRRDIDTDGRHATVAFGTNVAEDARRRDFTMNALYADRTGQVIDPLGGLPDLMARHVRFIGDATARLREDYLRSLRYFRFHAWYGNADAGVDPEAMSAIASNLEGLHRLSRERVGAEIFKLLSAPNPALAVAAMRSAGVLAEILPGVDDRALAPLIDLEGDADLASFAPLRMAALGSVQQFETLRLSRRHIVALNSLRQAATGEQSAAELGYRMKLPDAGRALALRCALMEQHWSSQDVTAAKRGAVAELPIRSSDLMPRFAGPELGQALRRLETAWIAADFRPTKEELMAQLN